MLEIALHMHHLCPSKVSFDSSAEKASRWTAALATERISRNLARRTGFGLRPMPAQSSIGASSLYVAPTVYVSTGLTATRASEAQGSWLGDWTALRRRACRSRRLRFADSCDSIPRGCGRLRCRDKWCARSSAQALLVLSGCAAARGRNASRWAAALRPGALHTLSPRGRVSCPTHARAVTAWCEFSARMVMPAVLGCAAQGRPPQLVAGNCSGMAPCGPLDMRLLSRQAMAMRLALCRPWGRGVVLPPREVGCAAVLVAASGGEGACGAE